MNSDKQNSDSISWLREISVYRIRNKRSDMAVLSISSLIKREASYGVLEIINA